MKTGIFLNRYLLALLVFNLAACSSMQPVNVASAMRFSPPSGVDYGSLVEVKTFDLRTAKFRVTDITDDGLGGKALHQGVIAIGSDAEHLDRSVDAFQYQLTS